MRYGQGLYLLSEPDSYAADASGAERRRGLRIRQNRPVKIYDPLSCRYLGGQTEDISATGLRISLPFNSYIRPGSLLNVHVGLGSGGQPLANRRQMMPAKVVWMDYPESGPCGFLQAGVEFTSSIAAHLDAA
jgi:hypothetical protein